MTKALRLLLILLVAGLATACETKPRVMPRLVPAAAAPAWPPPPETTRYTYVGDLVGETDFIDRSERSNRSTATKVLEFITGALFGEPDYKELRRPIAGMVDRTGRLLVVDVSLPGIMVFDFKTLDVEVWQEAGPGQSFSTPVGIADDGMGGFYVSDSELGAVFRLNAKGEPVGRLGEVELARPTGIARDSATGRIYVTDTMQHRIAVFDANGILVEMIGSRGTEPGKFNSPTHLAIVGNRLLVSDSLNFRIQVLNLEGENARTVGRLGVHVGDMMRPKGVAVGGDGRIYAIESLHDHLLVFDTDGQFLMPIGGTGYGPGKFYLPAGVWTDPSGRVYVADMFNGRVSIFMEMTGDEG